MHRNEWFEGVHKCKQDESLFAVMERIVKAEVHRLVVVNDDNKVVGVISLSDILNYLVLRPGGKLYLALSITGYNIDVMEILQGMIHIMITQQRRWKPPPTLMRLIIQWTLLRSWRLASVTW